MTPASTSWTPKPRAKSTSAGRVQIHCVRSLGHRYARLVGRNAGTDEQIEQLLELAVASKSPEDLLSCRPGP